MKEENVILEKRVRTLTDDPQYFGTYLNNARHNIFSISNFIGDQFGQAELKEDGDIPNSFLCKSEIKKLDWIAVFHRLLRYMPVVKQFDPELYPRSLHPKFEEMQLVQMNNTLKAVFKELQGFRNDYSHYFSTEKQTERKTQITSTLSNFLKECHELAIAYTKVRMKEVFNEEDFAIAEMMKLVEDENRITTVGLVFLICMFLTREQAFLFIGR